MIASTLALALAALPIAFGAEYSVQVGAGGRIAYDPEYVSAQPGDTINFIFNPKNHTVTQSSFNTPCVALDGGEKTGFIPVAAGTTDLPNRQFTVPAGNAPLWFYCGQVGHCTQGMVFAINPPADPSPNSFSAFKALAMGGAAASSSSPPPASSSVYVTPPAPHWVSATATVTYSGSVYTTTYTSYDGTPAPTPAPAPVDHKIVVGNNGALNYDPANITASIGDTVTFEFHPKNHTVTQSSFLNPCEPLNSGFKSGFKPVAADATEFPTFQITINDTAPIWGYCGQTGHCAQGMVFAINAVESGPNNFAAFLELARRSGSSASASGTAPSGTGTTASSTPSSAAIGFTSSSGTGMTFGLALSALVALWI